MSARSAVWLGVLVALALGLGPGVGWGEVARRVSVASNGGQGDDSSFNAALSADGRFVAFESFATNLVPADTNGERDIFVHDRQTGLTTRASVGSDGAQANGASFNPALSADGRVVAFESFATNLVPGDTNGHLHIFVHDRQTGQTTRISIASNGTQANSGSSLPALSADGRVVAFESGATNLVPGDTNGERDIFVHDRRTGQTTRVNVASDGTQGDGRSLSPALSADGQVVAFESDATTLVPGDTNGTRDVFVRDRQTGQTTRVSVASDGTQADSSTFELALSADGRIVAFATNATNLVPGDTNGTTDVFVHDRLTAQTSRVSVATGGTEGSGGDSLSPALSADGRFVAFQADMPTLVPGDTNDLTDVFVHDRLTGQTTRVSVAAGGAQAFGFNPVLSADGRVVAFEAGASNLVPGDTNGAGDVFVARVATGPTWLVTGAGGGGGPHLRGFDALGAGALLSSFAYSSAFAGGVRVATGDVTGDGAAEVITAAGPGGGPHVRVFTRSTAREEVAGFFAYAPTFAGGVFVAAGDVDDDGHADLVTGPGPGGGPHVRVFSGAALPALAELAGFFAYAPAFTGGVRVAAGDVDGDGHADLITAPGPGGGPHVRVFSGAALPALAELAGFFAYAPAFTGGAFVAAGDVDGDGHADIITGADAGGGPHVRIFSGAALPALVELAGFFAYAPAFGGGVRVAAGDVDGDGRADVITAPGPDGGPHVRVFSGAALPALAELAGFFAYAPAFTGGVFAAGLP